MHGPILNLAFYKFVPLNASVLGNTLPFPDSFASLRAEMVDLCKRCEIKGKIILSPEGINGFLAGYPEQIQKVKEYFAGFPVFCDLQYKESWSHLRPFKRMLVKLKQEVISIRDESVVPYESTAPRLSPRELKQWLDEGKDFLLLDTRNTYEVEYGTFQKATQLNLKNFMQLDQKLGHLCEKGQDVVKNRPMVMFCTGGIRCEKASVLAMRHGIQNVYQLEGGILKYFEEIGQDHYQGKCFVFDDRVAVDSSLNPENC